MEAAASSEALVSTTSSSSDREARAEALSLFDCGVSCCCCCATLPFSTACAHALTTFFAAASLLTPPACRAPLQVCLDTASEPVITFCGHLYCWGCLYLWMKARADSGALCPLTSQTEKKTEEAPEDADAAHLESRERAILSSSRVRARRAQAAALLQLD